MLEEAVDEVDIEVKVMISLKKKIISCLLLQFDQIVLYPSPVLCLSNILINKYFFEILNV